jgi:hypothetical protein
LYLIYFPENETLYIIEKLYWYLLYTITFIFCNY